MVKLSPVGISTSPANLTPSCPEVEKPENLINYLQCIYKNCDESGNCSSGGYTANIPTKCWDMIRKELPESKRFFVEQFTERYLNGWYVQTNKKEFCGNFIHPGGFY